MPVPITPNPELPQHPPTPPEPTRRHIEDPDPWLPPVPVQDPPAQPQPMQIYHCRLERVTRIGGVTLC
jgi:hypothetical protein